MGQPLLSDTVQFTVVVCPSLAICTAPTPHKTITVLYRLALWVLLMIGDGGLVVPEGALKMLDVKTTDVKLTDQFAGQEIAGRADKPG